MAICSASNPKETGFPFVFTFLFFTSLVFFIGCQEETLGEAVVLDQTQLTEQQTDRIELFKEDRSQSPFPSERDLVLIVPQYRAIYPILSAFKTDWLQNVDDALLESDMAQRMSEENKPEDWSLVSVRISPCSPLGNRADLEEIDRLCWPEVRLVLQPIVLMRRGRSTTLFADDRAIHALYRVEYMHPDLLQMQELTKMGLRLSDFDPEELKRFEHSRDEAIYRLLESVQNLRVTKEAYYSIAERPEFFDSNAETTFWERFTQNIIERYCQPDALHHLTGMSLPIGRAPVQLDLWSFVAFNAQNGLLERIPLEVSDRESGDVFFSFDELGKRSEDVSAALADPDLLDAFSSLDEDTQEKLRNHIILDQGQVSAHAQLIIDPYQTLVKHTTCSSCHRFNDTPFNFHNLSYFGDREISVSPRVEADVERDLDWLKRLNERTLNLKKEPK